MKAEGFSRKEARIAACAALAALLAAPAACQGTLAGDVQAPVEAGPGGTGGTGAADDPVGGGRPPEDLPRSADDFTLIDHRGVAHQLSRYDDRKALVLVSHGVGCPILRQHLRPLEELAARYAGSGVAVLYLNAQDPRDEVVAEAEEFGITLPILLDEAQLVSAGLGIDRMAEAIVVEPPRWRIVYRGAIDDRLDYGAQRPRAEHRYLEEALEALLAGRDPATEYTPTRGCLIHLEGADAEPGATSYSQDVAPILIEKCAACHVEGGIAPWAMSDHARVRRWGPMMREVIRTRRMPPWFADPNVGSFSNDAALSPEETRTIVRWIEDGAPRGEGPDPLAAYEPATPPGAWPFGGEPDLVVPIRRTMEVPPTGIVPYRFVVSDVEIPEDTWVRAAVLRPSNPEVLHHAFVFPRYPEGRRPDQPNYKRGLRGFFAIYAPGDLPAPFPPGTARFLPAGTRFGFQLHYVTTGKEETDRTELGLYFADEAPERELITFSALNTSFRIPAGAPAHAVRAHYRFDDGATLYELLPHMHYRGRSFRYEAHYPDGSTETLLSVPDFDFNYQLTYRLEEPKLLPPGTVVVCHGVFDNSAQNPLNPDPDSVVRFGYQSFEEMFIGYMTFVRGGE